MAANRECLTTNARSLRMALSACMPLRVRNAKIPILSGVLISGQEVIMESMDHQLTLTMGASAPAVNPVVVELQSLENLLRHIDGDLTIRIDTREEDDVCQMSFNGARYDLVTYPVSDYPKDLIRHEEVIETGIHNHGLVAAMRRISFAMSREETRYYLNGVAISRNHAGKPCVVATDGHRLAVMPIATEIEAGDGKIVAFDTVRYLIRNRLEPVSCGFGERTCRFIWPGMRLRARLIDGTYPDWRRIFPAERSVRLRFDRVEMWSAVRRILSFAPEGYASVKLQANDHGVTLTRRGRCGSCCEEIFAAKLIGLPFETGINAHYLRDLLQAFSGAETLSLSCGGEPGRDPLLFEAIDDDLQVVQMPMRI